MQLAIKTPDEYCCIEIMPCKVLPGVNASPATALRHSQPLLYSPTMNAFFSESDHSRAIPSGFWPYFFLYASDSLRVF